jgi:hypothetical protein
MPATVAEIRQERCQAADCRHSLDYGDPCAACPEGHWGPYVRCEADLPPPTAMAANLTKAVAAEAGAVLRGVPAITHEEAAARFAICRGCADWFRPSDERCAHPGCGCFLRVKTAWRAQRCPAGKW